MKRALLGGANAEGLITIAALFSEQGRCSSNAAIAPGWAQLPGPFAGVSGSKSTPCSTEHLAPLGVAFGVDLSGIRLLLRPNLARSSQDSAEDMDEGPEVSVGWTLGRGVGTVVVGGGGAFGRANVAACDVCLRLA